MGVILHALPFEMMIIGGAAVGSYILSNSGDVLKHTFPALIRAFKGPVWHAHDHEDLLCLLLRGRRCGFADASHFVREFQRQFRTTPARWRRERIRG